MCRGVMLLLAAVLLQSEATAQTVRVSVDCNGRRLGAAERETCASPSLMRLTASVDELTARLERALTGRNREALVDTEAPFVRQRNDCSNTAAGARGCVEGLLRHRLDALTAAITSPASIVAETTRYTFLDVPFLLKWGSEFVGRRVRVWGCMKLEPGPTPASRLRGTLHDPSPEPGARAAASDLPVVFTRMDETRATGFYDAKQPVGYWEGTVRRQDGRLALTDVAP